MRKPPSASESILNSKPEWVSKPVYISKPIVLSESIKDSKPSERSESKDLVIQNEERVTVAK